MKFELEVSCHLKKTLINFWQSFWHLFYNFLTASISTGQSEYKNYLWEAQSSKANTEHDNSASLVTD